jgi:hypothetical protein
MDSHISLSQNGLRTKGTESNWSTVLGNKPLPMTGIVMFKFKTVLLQNAIEIGIRGSQGNYESYIGKAADGFAFQYSHNSSSNDGIWHYGNNINYG